ncbi:hypothetical protein FRC12_019706, partial [Ceratobasidium sp. 428]
METSKPAWAKRLLIFCDGPWPKYDWYPSDVNEMFPKGWDDPPFLDDRPSNVLRLSRCIEPLSHDNIYQVVLHKHSDDSHRRLSADEVSVAFAWKIWEIYNFITKIYGAGDQIYIFGILEGAFMARKVASLLDALGILDDEQMRSFFRYWRDSNQPHTNRPGREVEIELLGIWDSAVSDLENIVTVKLADLLGAKNNSLPACVKRARYAMAYHEANAQYTAFEVSGGDRRAAQVWFPGTRPDVGGEYPYSQISDISLLWMAGEIQDMGIDLNITGLAHLLSSIEISLGLEVRDINPQECDSEETTQLWKIEGRGELFQASMSDPSAYCHRSMWAPLVRLSQPHPTDPQDRYYPAYWTQPVLPAPL